MPSSITPICQYGHGNLKRAPGEDGEPGNYIMPEVRRGIASPGYGYHIEVWECTECSYVELHDGEKRQK